MGSRIAEQDRERSALNALALQTGQQNLQQSAELHPLRAMALRAQAERQQAEAKKLQLQQMALDKWLEKRETQREGGPSTPEGQLTDAAEQLAEMAKFQAGVGDLDGARKTHGTLSQVVSRGVRASQQDALRKKTEFETQMKMADKALGYLRGVRGPEELRLAGDAFEMEYGKRLPVFDMPYSQENIQRALNTGLTERQARLTQHEKEMEKFRGISSGLEGARTRALQDRTRAYVDRQKVSTDRLKKVGTDTAGTPRQMEDAQMLLLQQHPELAEAPVELSVGAASIVSEAKDILKSRKGLTWAQALQAAYRNQKDNIKEETKGALEVGGIPIPFTGGTKTRFDTLGKGAKAPLPMPKTPQEATVGEKYLTPTGVRRYLGNGRLSEVLSEPSDEEALQEPEAP
jgi:hypothetical protein